MAPLPGLDEGVIDVHGIVRALGCWSSLPIKFRWSSVSFAGQRESIEFVPVDFVKEFCAEPLLSSTQKDLTLAGLRMGFAQAGFGRQALRLREFQAAL
jgi:hypothetical protein